jgi:hypothetical protein
MSEPVFNYEEIAIINEAKSTLLDLLIPRLEQLPLQLQSLLFEKGILTGGATSSVMQRGIPNDYDIYLTDENDISLFRELLKMPEVMQFVADVNEKYKANLLVDGKVITANATTFNNHVQVITCGYAKSREKFDYVHCMPYINIKERKLYISKTQYLSIKNKTLKINPNAERVDDHRTNKFLERGWRV